MEAPPSPTSDEPPHYTLRLLPVAYAEINLARERLAVTWGEAIADTGTRN